MKIAFIDPPWPGHGHRTQRWPHKNLHGDINPPPLYQMLAAAVVRQEGHQTRLWDAPAERLELPQLLEDVTNFAPELAVINSSTPSFDHDLAFMAALHQVSPRLKILLVGPHATVFWREILEKHHSIDFIGLAEYDFLPRDLCRAGFDPSTVAGVAFRDDRQSPRMNQAKPIDNLDLLPFADYSLVKLERYNEFLFPIRKRPIATVITSRGCPFQCSFCLYPQVLFGHKLRVRSISNVLDEIRHLVDTYGVKFIYFEDDTFTASWKRVRQFCEALIESGVTVNWGCLGRVTGASLENLRLMKQAGCYLIKYGVETAEQNQLDNLHKDISVDEIKQAFRQTHQAGIYSHATVMFGYPGDNLQTIDKTHALLHEIRPDYVQFSMCIPFPGTSLYQDCLQNKLLVFDTWEDFDGAWGGVIETVQLTREQVRNAVINGYKRYYFTVSYLLRRAFRSVRGPDAGSQWLHNIDLMKRFVRRYVLKRTRKYLPTKGQ